MKLDKDEIRIDVFLLVCGLVFSFLVIGMVIGFMYGYQQVAHSGSLLWLLLAIPCNIAFLTVLLWSRR